ncbi:MAG: helix-turn-helix transcriptional regulator [Nocardioides sp.]
MRSIRETVLAGDPLEAPPGAVAVAPATMSIAQAAAYVGISKSTLYTWRTRRPGFGPRAVKAGAALRYRRSDLDAWIDAHIEELDLAPELDAEGDVHRSARVTSPRSPSFDSMSRSSRPRRQ